MTILSFGLSHKTAPLSLLERVSMTPEAMQDFLAGLHSHQFVKEAFGLSTCNRTEFLMATSNAKEAMIMLLNRLHDRKGIDLRAHAENTFAYSEEEAIRHIFQVACGIDSLVIGETEILGQLRRAREAASDAGTIGELLDPMLLRAIDVGRRARQSTAISRGNVSVASVGATLATRTLGDLVDKTGIVLGAGETAEAAAGQLAERGLHQLTIVNRTPERAQPLAVALGARVAGLDQLGRLLREADVVVCATAAPHFIITLPMGESAMAARAHRLMMLLDLSVPRNIDPAIADVPGVFLHSQEDLAQLAAENRAQRESQVHEVNQLVDQELAAYQGLRLSADSGRLAGALHRRMEQVRRDYVGRNRQHFAPEQNQQLEMFSSGLTRSLLHEIVDNLRGINLETTEGRRRYEIARELLNVPPDDAN